jgi:hypothetical protein
MKSLTQRIFNALVCTMALGLIGLVIALPLALLSATPVSADNYGYLANFLTRQEPAGQAVATVSTDVTVLVRYVGAQSGTVAVAAGGDLTFKEGTAAAETASTSFECPVSGALGGVIDVSDTACDTLGELVDTINGSCTGCISTNWRAVILGGLRSDSSNNTLATLSETAATASAGLGLLNDNAVSFNNTIVVSGCRDFTCGFVSGNTMRASPPMVENPWKGTQSVIWSQTATTTYGSGTSTFQIIDVDVKNKAGEAGSETATVVWSSAAGASTTASAHDYPYGFFGCKKDHKCIVRIANSEAMTAATHSVYATIYPYAR